MNFCVAYSDNMMAKFSSDPKVFVTVHYASAEEKNNFTMYMVNEKLNNTFPKSYKKRWK